MAGELGATTSAKVSAQQRLRFFLWGLAICFVAAFVYAAASERPAATSVTQNFSLQVLGQTARSLQAQLDEYQDIAFQFVANRDLNQLLTDYVSARDPYEVSLQNQQFSNFLEGYAFRDEGLYDAFFLDEANRERKALTMREGLPNAFLKSFRHSRLYQEIVQANGQVVWSGALRPVRSGTRYVALGKRIKHLFSGRPLGVLVILVKGEQLNQLVTEYLKTNFYFSVGTIRTSYTLILDDQGTVISTSLPEHLGQDVTRVIQGSGQLALPFNRRREKGSFLGRIHGKPVLVVFQRVGPGWRLLLPVATVLGDRFPRALRRFALVLAVGGVALWLGLRIVRPGSGVIASGAGQPGSGSPAAPFPAGPLAGVAPEWVEALNEREKAILSLLAQGCSNREIAQRLFMAEQTVKNYVSTIYAKMGVHDRVQASLKAVEAGFHLSSFD